jgi:hypothetical protein
MPIAARCPNPTCGQVLQVPDEYAGMQGKCPTCGAMVLFQQSATAVTPAPSQPAPAPAAPPPYRPDGFAVAPPAAPLAGYEQAPLPGQPPLAPAGPPMSREQLVQMICVPAGLFFLLLLVICAFLPWGPPKFARAFVRLAEVAGSREMPTYSGIHLGDAGIVMVLCLLLLAAGGLTYLFKWLVPTLAAVAAGFGLFAIFFMLGAITDYGSMARAGVWLGLVAAIGTAGAFVPLAIFRPVESPTLHSLNFPLMKPHGGLVIAAVCGLGLGFLYMILAALS